MERLYQPLSEAERAALCAYRPGTRRPLSRFIRKILPLLAVLGAALLLIGLARLLYPYSATQLDSTCIQSPPSGKHWLGTNQLGQDFFAQLLQGVIVSLFISFCSAVLSAALGTLYGAISGYVGGKVDLVMSRCIEIISCVPPILWIFVLSAILKKGLLTIILVLSFSAWANTAIIVRGRVLEIKQRDFVKAARAMGASPLYAALVHILPNCLSLVLVQIQLLIPYAIFSEAMLSYVGIGIQQPNVSFGTVLKKSTEAIYMAPYQLLCCVLVLLSIVGFFYILGEKLKEASEYLE